MSFLKSFLRNEEGLDSAECALLLAFLALAVGALYVTLPASITGFEAPDQNDLTAAAQATG